MPKKAKNSGNKRRPRGRVKKAVRARVSRARRAAKPAKRRAKARPGRVKVVRSRSTRASRGRKSVARKPVRPLPPAEMLAERLFLSSLERSLRDNRTVWEALAKK